VGTPADARTDIYAFGCVLYEMLTGERVALQRKRIRARKLETIVSQCLEEDPRRRWQSATELQRALAAVPRASRGLNAAAHASLPRAPKPIRKSKVVLGEFENKTGDPVFDGILRHGLSVQLEQSPFLTLVSDQQVQQVLRFMNRPPETRLTPEVAQEICERTGGTAVLEGSIASFGSQYVLWLRARNCRTGDILGQEQAQAGAKEGADYVRKAYELRDRVSDRERLFILFLYDRQVTGNLQKELETLESWAQTYPGDFLPLGLLGGWGTRGTGQYERGIQTSERALRINPGLTPLYGNLVELNLCLDRFAEAAAALQRAAERKLEVPLFLVNRYYLAFLMGDEAGMKREIDRARGNLEAEGWMSHNEALVLARCGQMRNARIRWQHTIELAQQTGDREKAAIYQAAEAVCEAHFGNWDRARERARAALELGKGRDIEFAAAFALALSGDSSGSRSLAEDLAQRFPEDTPVQFEYLPTLRALFALHDKSPSDAIERLQTALPYDLAMPGTAFFAKFGGLYPAYVRGQAYLEAGRGREAAAEFQTVLDHRGIVLADPIGVLAHLQLGRALALSGENDKARSAYQAFLTLWKDADPAIPVFKQACAEYAKL
jgi:tetratricopeptide (TPR) repeat protein